MRFSSEAEAGALDSEVLLATCWTSAGKVSPDQADIRSPVDLRQRIELASGAGFCGFGVHAIDLDGAIRTYGLSGLRSILLDNGIDYVEIEGIPAWWSSTPDRNPQIQAVLTAATGLGVRHLKLNPASLDEPWDHTEGAERFRHLAAMTEELGIRLGLEFLPWTTIPDLRSGTAFLKQADHPNAGLVIDIWHVERSATSIEDLLLLPRELVSGVELNDADSEVVGELYADTIDRRRYCGEGSFALSSFVAALRHIGWTGPWGVEILSVEHREAELERALRKASTTARQVLDPSEGMAT